MFGIMEKLHIYALVDLSKFKGAIFDDSSQATTYYRVYIPCFFFGTNDE